jgi:hypothetical protein
MLHLQAAYLRFVMLAATSQRGILVAQVARVASAGSVLTSRS